MKHTLKKTYPYILFFLSAIVLLWRARLSFCSSDETFYFSTTYRFYQGDSIFLHDWFPTQLSSILLLPFFSLYMLINGSVDGILLFFRQLFVIFSFVNACFVYNMLRFRKNSFVALVAGLFLMFYTHLNIATLSYYTMSVQFFVLAMTLLYYYYDNRKNKYLIISGILYALSVLALPTMALAYILIVIVLIALLIVSNKSSNKFTAFTGDFNLPDVLKYTFIGILIPAAIFMIFLLTNVSVKDFISAIPYVLSDEEHVTNLVYPFKKFLIGINEVYGTCSYISYLLIVICMILHPFKLIENKFFKLSVFFIDSILYIYFLTCSFNHTGYIFTAIILYALPLFFLTKNKDKYLFFTFVANGLVFSMVYSYSSNGYLYILSMGHFIASIGGIIAIYDFAREFTQSCQKLRAIKSIPAVLTTIFIVFALVQTMYLRIVNIYRDAPLNELISQIDVGPAKGLYTTPAHRDLYMNTYETITTYCTSTALKHDGNIFITKLLPYGYLCTDLKCAAPTSWRTAFNSVRLEPYYEINPDRTPDIILVLNEEYGSYLTCGDVEADPNPNANEIDGFLLDYVNSNNYTKKDVACGTIYQR